MESKIESAVDWAIGIANDNSHGYSQTVRWGPSYDCSSLVISAYQQAGVPVKTRGATYTGNMRQAFLSCGFKNVTGLVNLATGAGLKRGDVLLNDANHTAMMINSTQLVHARSSEGTTDTADNSGNEIRVQSYWNHPWNCVLRYPDDEEAEPVDKPQEKPQEETAPEVNILYMTTRMPIIKPNMAKIPLECVRTLQIILNGKGENLTVDSLYGWKTQTATENWQKNHSLEPDKEVGALTWRSLLTEK